MTTGADARRLHAVYGALRRGPVAWSTLETATGLVPSRILRVLAALESEGWRFRNRGEDLELLDDDGFGPHSLALVLGRPLLFRATTPSTNDDARGLALRGAPAGALAVADTQTAGRGRRGRSWESPPGVNLYFSLVFRPGGSPAGVPRLGLAVAVGLAEALDLSIKWPNDLLSPQGRKVAGLLAEMELAGTGVDFVVVGVGVNVNQAVFPSHLGEAESLYRVRGSRLHRGRLLAACVDAAEAGVKAMEADPASVLQRWRRRCPFLGREVQVHTGVPGAASPGAVVRGIMEGVRPDGALLVRTPEHRTRAVLAGDVEMVGRTPSGHEDDPAGGVRR